MKEYSIENIMDAFNECAKQLEEKNKEIERLNAQIELLEDNRKFLNKQIEEKDKRIKELEDGFKASTDEFCDYASRVDKAIKWIENNDLYDLVGDDDDIMYDGYARTRLLEMLKGEE